MYDIPLSIMDKAEEIGFGRVEDAFRPRYLQLVYGTATFPAFLGATFVLLIVAGNPGGRVAGYIGVAVAIAALGLGLKETRQAIRRRIYLCEGGLLIADPPTRVTRTIAWKDIADVRRNHPRIDAPEGIMPHRCKLVLTDGSEINLEKPLLIDGQFLGMEVELRTALVRLPRVLAKLKSRRRADFGELEVTSDGVRSADGILTWSNIRLARIRRKQLTIYGHNGHITVPVWSVSNLMTLLLLLERREVPLDVDFLAQREAR